MANFDSNLRQSLPRNSRNSHSAIQSSNSSNNSVKPSNKVTSSNPNPQTSTTSNNSPGKTIFLPPYVEKPIASELIT